MIVPRKELESLPKTVHGGQAWRIGGVEDYSHNLNPFGPPEDLPDILLSAVDGIGHYPDDSSADLRATISQVYGISEGSIIIGSGSSDVIRMFPNTFLDRGDRVCICRPSFAEYAQQCTIAGAKVEYLDLLPEDDFRIDCKRLSEKIQSGIKAVYICNPNNPTGRVEPREKILKIVSECKEKGVLVFLDETLLELCAEYDSISCAAEVSKYDNLVVAGSLTKSFAIPGIRIGFGFASPSLIKWMNKVRMSWNVGHLEQCVANVLIGERTDYVTDAAETMASEAVRLNAMMKDAGFPTGDVADSFFYFESVRPLGLDGAGFRDRLLEKGYMVRDCSSFGPEFRDYIRYSVKDSSRNEGFVEAVRKVIEEL